MSTSSLNKSAESNDMFRKENADLHRTFQVLIHNEERFRMILENSYDVIFLVNLVEQSFDFVSPASLRIWGYTPEEIKAIGIRRITTLAHPDDQESVWQHFSQFIKRSQGEKIETIEMRMKSKSNGYRWMSCCHTLIKQPLAIVGNVRDIHIRKNTEIELQKLKGILEKELKKRTEDLEKANIALKLMLKKEQEIKTEIENKVQYTLMELILPMVSKLRTNRLDRMQRQYLDILESNLRGICSPFTTSLVSKISSLTPGEIEIANLVKHGRNTKEIAELLFLSRRTVEFYRSNIRKKLGLRHKKENLRDYLLALDQ